MTDYDCASACRIHIVDLKHRNVIQDLALSSGYYTEVPLIDLQWGLRYEASITCDDAGCSSGLLAALKRRC
ncbi:hypothetical protein CLOM_g8584 [Closterium sp. NIES-68]|nr:hypothetical protein CLOM_g8584 [Closterium sp. NIES-68]GJP86310.1 hypothetical protein CLOP_g16351 [Closterium sp. NIES-67]